MKIDVRLWAQIRIAAGGPRITLEVPAGARVADLLAALDEAHPEVARARASARVAVGNDYADLDRVLREGDEVSLIPPVQGG